MSRTNVERTRASLVAEYARQILESLRLRWRPSLEEIDWGQIADLAYWRFCRFASSATARVRELGGSAQDYAALRLVVVEFVELVGEVVTIADTLPAPREAASDVEKIRRARIHCMERIVNLRLAEEGKVAFSNRVNTLVSRISARF